MSTPGDNGPKSRPRKRKTKAPNPSKRAKPRPAKDGSGSGRKPLLDEAMVERMEMAASRGASMKAIAAVGGVEVTVLFRYLQRAEEEAEQEIEGSLFIQLRNRLTQARELGNIALLEDIRRAARADWRAAAHLLAIKDPDSYSRRKRFEVTGDGGSVFGLQLFLPVLEGETLDEGDESGDA